MAGGENGSVSATRRSPEREGTRRKGNTFSSGNRKEADESTVRQLEIRDEALQRRDLRCTIRD